MGTRTLLLAGTAATLLLAACAGPSATARSASSSALGTQEVVLNARDVAFMPATLALRAGAPARIVFVNEGKLEHDVTIAGVTADGKPVEGHGHEEAGHGMAPLAPGTVHVSAHAGERAVAAFTPKPGTYEYACTLPGHRDAGMRGTLTVG